jgi:hypothetical protein
MRAYNPDNNNANNTGEAGHPYLIPRVVENADDNPKGPFTHT